MAGDLAGSFQEAVALAKEDQDYGIQLLHELNCTTNEEDPQVTSVSVSQ